MPGPAEDQTVARLMADPSALVAEIARYTQLKAEAESKMRAVVDEASAQVYLDGAKAKLFAAERDLEIAHEEARKVTEDAALQAEKVTRAAVDQATSVTAEAVREANALVLKAAQELEKSVEANRQAEEQLSSAKAMEEKASSAVEKNVKAASSHVEAAKQLSAARARLTGLVREMREIVGE